MKIRDDAGPSSHSTGKWQALTAQPADGLLALIGLYAADNRHGKIDLGVGVYKTQDGHTPVFEAVKAAEAILLSSQTTKSYVGPEGDIDFFKALARLMFGDMDVTGRLAGVQTPGGTGALRLGFELVSKASPTANVHVGSPTWPNHSPLVAAAGLPTVPHRHIDLSTQQLCYDDILSALRTASPGDVVLLQGSCHNPTGADFDADQWATLAQVMADRDLLPFIDLAYQGLGDGLDADAAGVQIVAQRCQEMLVAYSCDKNFGLYRDRVGALFLLAKTAKDAQTAQSNLLSLTRANWSMPPDHGAAVVRIILESLELTAQWRAELATMQRRIAAMRSGLAAIDPSLEFLTAQKGMFSTLNLSPAQITALREDHAVYMAGSGRINIAGLVPTNLAPFAAALAAVR